MRRARCSISADLSESQLHNRASAFASLDTWVGMQLGPGWKLTTSLNPSKNVACSLKALCNLRMASRRPAASTRGVIFVSAGTRGDVLPAVLLAKALAADDRNASVVILTHASHQVGFL